MRRREVLAHNAEKAAQRVRELRVQRRAARFEDADISAVLAGARPAAAATLTDRIGVLLDALDRPARQDGPLVRTHELERALEQPDASRIWLTIAVLTGRLPVDDEVIDVLRRVRLEGPGRGLAPTLATAAELLATDHHPPQHVEVLRDVVMVDVHHTWQTDLATGIQRVVWETVSRWDRDHDVEFVAWSDGFETLMRLDRSARSRSFGESPVPNGHGSGADAAARPPAVVVPWTSTFLVPELAAEPARSQRILALARHSGNRTGTIGYDCVPLTTAETSAEGMGPAFTKTLAAVRHMDAVATISHAAAAEYRGWRGMLAGTGLPGPDINPIPLPAEAQPTSAEALATVRSRYAVGHLPLVLVVGSHEPRKNHLAVLHAAELLWRQGKEFSLLFVGGNSWKSERFSQRLHELRAQGRPIEATLKLTEDVLWATYRIAHVVLFPSLNEGFGLPVAEALACGVPAITSNFGSMAEIAEDGGALLVDPRDDHHIAEALARILDDPTLRDDLVAQAQARPARTWDRYAADVWAYLVGEDPTP